MTHEPSAGFAADAYSRLNGVGLVCVIYCVKMQSRGFSAAGATKVGPPAETICDYAHEHDVDLIIASTQGSTGLKHAFVGSTSEHIVRYAPCPVLVGPSLVKQD